MTDLVLQGTPEWEAQRCGKLTASRFHEAIARTKTGWSASRKNYRDALVAQRMRQLPLEQGWISKAMQQGKEREPQARAAYAFYRDVEVIQVGFIDHPSINMAGCSPDGLVEDDGLVEIKCPETPQHFDMLLDEPIKHAYQVQIAWQLACTGRAWCDFVSFDPTVDQDLQLKIIRVPRSDEFIAELEREARTFLAEVDARLELLNRIRQKQAA
jgi:hypothetical protein